MNTREREKEREKERNIERGKERHRERETKIIFTLITPLKKNNIVNSF